MLNITVINCDGKHCTYEYMDGKDFVSAIDGNGTDIPMLDDVICELETDIESIADYWSKELHTCSDLYNFVKWSSIKEVLDEEGVRYEIHDSEALIEFWTDVADQDIPTEFDYNGTPDDFVKQFSERAGNYDVDEEVELYANMRGKNGVPGTIRELMEDCQDAKNTLIDLAKKLQTCIKPGIKKFKVTYTEHSYLEIEIEADSYFSGARAVVLDQGLTVNLEERTAVEMFKKKYLL